MYLYAPWKKGRQPIGAILGGFTTTPRFKWNEHRHDKQCLIPGLCCLGRATNFILCCLLLHVITKMLMYLANYGLSLAGKCLSAD